MTIRDRRDPGAHRVAARRPPVAHEAIEGTIIQRLILSAVREMGTTLLRATRSPVLFEAKDFATGLFDSRGRVLEYHQYLPLMAFCLGPAVEAVIERWGSEVAPGDVFIHNDPYTGGTHTMDVAVIAPVFSHGRLVAWAACKGHMLDWGGPVPSGYNSNASTIWEEPLTVPAVHLRRAGERCEDVYELLRAAVRVPDVVLHDIDAMVGCTEVGGRRFNELVDRFTLDVVSSTIETWLEGTGTRVRRELAGLPEGIFRGKSTLGLASGETVEIVLQVELGAEKVVVDLTGTSGQTRSFVNAPQSVTEGAVFHCLAMMLGPGFNFNQGFIDTIEVKVPPGTVLSAQEPAAVGYCLHLSDQIAEAFFTALAEAVPDRVITGWLQWGTSIGGTWDGKAFATPVFFLSKGGSGAVQGADGYDYIGSIRMAGALEAEDVEVFEQTHGWAEVLRLEYWSDSGGPGQWRGGLGSHGEIRLLGEEMEVSAFGTGQAAGGYGLFGGQSSPRSRLEIEHPDGRREDVPAHANLTRLRPGTILRKWNTGGGGYGPPAQRDHSLVLRDLDEGYISEEAARVTYGLDSA